MYKVFFTSIWWRCHPFATASAIMVHTVVIFATGAKVLFIVDPMCLCVSFRYESGFVALNLTVGIVLHFVYPSVANRLLVW